MDALAPREPKRILGSLPGVRMTARRTQTEAMTVTEPELIKRARGGDEDAFGELVTHHADRVYAALRRFGLDMTEAEEVAQEVFLRAWRGLERFQERAVLLLAVPDRVQRGPAPAVQAGTGCCRARP